MIAKLTGEGDGDDVKKNHIAIFGYKKRLLSLESCSACPEDQLELF